MIQGPPNTLIPLQLIIEPRFSDRYVRVAIERMDDTLVGNVDLTYTRLGSYSGSFTHPTEEFLKTIFTVYLDSQYTQVDPNIGTTGKIYRIKKDPPSLQELLSSSLAKVRYENRMTTVFNSSNGEHEIIAWADRDGQRVTNTSNCTVVVVDSLGNTQYSDSSQTPNSDGVYRFNRTFSPGADKNFYVIISIRVDGEYRTSHQSFFTLG